MCVWSGTLSASLTVQLYNGHSSTLSLTVFATNRTGFVTMFVYYTVNKCYVTKLQELHSKGTTFSWSVSIYSLSQQITHLEVLKNPAYTPLHAGMDGIEELKIQLNSSIFIGLNAA